MSQIMTAMSMQVHAYGHNVKVDKLLFIIRHAFLFEACVICRSTLWLA